METLIRIWVLVPLCLGILCTNSCSEDGDLPPVRISDTEQALESQLYIYGTAASQSYPGAPPSNATDGDPYTAWNAGVGESSQPFLQIDLGSNVPVNRLELLVAQYPSGSTTHRIIGYTDQWVAVDLGTFSGFTYGGMTISHYTTSHTPVRWIRIITTSSPSWVAWYEVRAYKHIPTGYLYASAATCSVPYNGSFCAPVQLQASIPSGEYGRVWVAQAPPGAPELGNWVFDTYSPPVLVGWIRPGTYRFELREGPYANGTVLSTVYVTGQQQPPPPAKLFGYFGTWVPWVSQTVNSISETIDHTNLVWASPALHGDLFKSAVLDRPDVSKVALDGSVILFGRATCNGQSRIVYYDGTCTPDVWPELPLASQRYDYLLSQLSYQQYQKIGWIFPYDEPDIYVNKPDANFTDANLADAKAVITQVAKNRFGQNAAIPKFSIIYSYLAVPMNSTVPPPVGAASADVVAVNCYPVSYGPASNSAPSACVDAPSNSARFNRLKQLVPGKMYFLVAETALARTRDGLQSRTLLAQNLADLRKMAQADSSVEGVIGFNWRGLTPVTDGADWLGTPELAGSPYDYKSVVVREGKCIAQKGQWQCPP